MNQITIVSKSGKGTEALILENKERLKMRAIERLQLKSLFDVRVDDNPFKIIFISKTRFLGYVAPNALVQNIEDNLKLRGCVKGVDYDVILE